MSFRQMKVNLPRGDLGLELGPAIKSGKLSVGCQIKGWKGKEETSTDKCLPIINEIPVGSKIISIDGLNIESNDFSAIVNKLRASSQRSIILELPYIPLSSKLHDENANPNISHQNSQRKADNQSKSSDYFFQKTSLDEISPRFLSTDSTESTSNTITPVGHSKSFGTVIQEVVKSDHSFSSNASRKNKENNVSPVPYSPNTELIKSKEKIRILEEAIATTQKELSTMKNERRGNDGQITFLKYQLDKLKASCKQERNSVISSSSSDETLSSTSETTAVLWLTHWSKFKHTLHSIQSGGRISTLPPAVPVLPDPKSSINSTIADTDNTNSDNNRELQLKKELKIQERVSYRLEMQLRTWVDSQISLQKMLAVQDVEQLFLEDNHASGNKSYSDATRSESDYDATRRESNFAAQIVTDVEVGKEVILSTTTTSENTGDCSTQRQTTTSYANVMATDRTDSISPAGTSTTIVSDTMVSNSSGGISISSSQNYELPQHFLTNESLVKPITSPQRKDDQSLHFDLVLNSKQQICSETISLTHFSLPPHYQNVDDKKKEDSEARSNKQMTSAKDRQNHWNKFIDSPAPDTVITSIAKTNTPFSIAFENIQACGENKEDALTTPKSKSQQQRPASQCSDNKSMEYDNRSKVLTPQLYREIITSHEKIRPSPPQLAVNKSTASTSPVTNTGTQLIVTESQNRSNVIQTVSAKQNIAISKEFSVTKNVIHNYDYKRVPEITQTIASSSKINPPLLNTYISQQNKKSQVLKDRMIRLRQESNKIRDDLRRFRSTMEEVREECTK